MRLVICAIFLAGCGYGFVRDDGGPVASLRLGTVEDLSAEGDLGLLATRTLRRQLVRRLGDGPTLVGELHTTEEHIAASDGAGLMYEVGVRLALRLVDARGAALWTSGPVTRHAVYLRGGSPHASREARRHALAQATQAAADEAAARLLNTPRAT